MSLNMIELDGRVRRRILRVWLVDRSSRPRSVEY